MLFKPNILLLLWLSVEVANALVPGVPAGQGVPGRKVARGPASSSATATSVSDTAPIESGTSSTRLKGSGSCKVRAYSSKAATSTGLATTTKHTSASSASSSRIKGSGSCKVRSFSSKAATSTTTTKHTSTSSASSSRIKGSGSCKVRHSSKPATSTTPPATKTRPITTPAPSTKHASSTSSAKAPECTNWASVNALEGTSVDLCVCKYKNDHISFKPVTHQGCPTTIPASVMSSLTSTSTTTTGPATVTIDNWPFTVYGGNGAVTACASSSVVDYAGYPVTQCAGSTSLIHTAVSYSTTVNVSPNGMLDYGNWTDFNDIDWDKDTDADRTSTLYSAFYTALSTLCHESSTTTVLTVTGLSTDIQHDKVATVTTPTTMYQCAVATATAENIRYTANDESEEAKLTVTVPFSHFDLDNLDKWVNMTAFALVANAMQSGNTWEGEYLASSGRGPGVAEKIVQHTGPSLVDLSYFSSLNEGILEQFQVQVGFKESESEFDCALMAEVEEFASAILAFFDPAIAAELIPEEVSLETLCNLAQGN